MATEGAYNPLRLIFPQRSLPCHSHRTPPLGTFTSLSEPTYPFRNRSSNPATPFLRSANLFFLPIVPTRIL
jgi:hypothetical protein